MASAKLIERQKFTLDGGATVQIKIWRLPKPTVERPHGLKYSLFYGRDDQRIIGYDNETGKGDHRHYRDREERYEFTTFETLVSDFWRDVKKEIENERGQTTR
ncbi:MAG: DUF6516 family protein [Methylocella sp.]